MTKRRLRELYEAARAAAHASGMLSCDEGEVNKLGAALDQIIEECDPWEAGLVDWAMENGYPALETVLRYGR